MTADHRQGRLASRPTSPSDASSDAGVHSVTAQGGHGLVYVPPSAIAGASAPLLVMLHGAAATGADVLPIVRGAADAHGILVLAPDADGGRWDLLHGGFGRDVGRIDAVMRVVFDQYAVDAAHIAIGGFSDGASYALSLGMTNGDLFPTVLAYSPGFAAPATRRGRPRLYLSHGTGDPVLPIQRCSRPLAASLEAAAYQVRYREFDGGHTVPAEVVTDSMEFWLGAEASAGTSSGSRT